MERLDLAEMFLMPDSFQPPPVSELSQNTCYPNLNSLEYQSMQPPAAASTDQQYKVQKLFEFLAINELENVVLVCNNYTSRVWNGSFWGYETVDDVGQVDKAAFKVQYSSPITNIRYVASNMLLVSDSIGAICLWSTKAEVGSQHGYCLFNIARQCEHIGIVTSLEISKTESTRAMSGSMDCCLKLWDMAAEALCSTNTYRYAHIKAINGISSSPTTPSNFVTASQDKTWKLWDTRLSRPVIAQYEHIHPFTTINWTNSSESNAEIYIGDIVGNVHVIDSRNIKKFKRSFQTFDYPIHRIQFNSKLFAVLAHTNTFKIFDTSRECKLIYENSDAKDYVRDICWTGGAAAGLADGIGYSVGWDSTIRKHKICLRN